MSALHDLRSPGDYLNLVSSVVSQWCDEFVGRYPTPGSNCDGGPSGTVRRIDGRDEIGIDRSVFGSLCPSLYQICLPVRIQYIVVQLSSKAVPLRSSLIAQPTPGRPPKQLISGIYSHNRAFLFPAVYSPCQANYANFAKISQVQNERKKPLSHDPRTSDAICWREVGDLSKTSAVRMIASDDNLAARHCRLRVLDFLTSGWVEHGNAAPLSKLKHRGRPFIETTRFSSLLLTKWPEVVNGRTRRVKTGL